MPGRQLWGEISSCSDCTDYQARRLDIKDNQDRLDVGIKAGYNLDLLTLVLNICVFYENCTETRQTRLYLKWSEFWFKKLGGYYAFSTEHYIC